MTTSQLPRIAHDEEYTGYERLRELRTTWTATTNGFSYKSMILNVRIGLGIQ